MYISKVSIRNYKIFENTIINMNPDINIFAGENDSGKTTILEAISMCLSGKINGTNVYSKVTPDWFNINIRNKYKEDVVNCKSANLPKIEIEVFFDGLNDEDIIFKHYRGTNNSLKEDCVGVRMRIIFNNDYCDTYKELLRDKKIIDIPVELYKIEYSSFAQGDYYINNTSKKIAIIDTTKKDYGSVLNKFVSNSIASYLSEEDETNLRLAYRSNRKNFKESEVVKLLNEKIKDEPVFKGRSISFNLKEGEIDNWKNEMSLSIDNIPFENSGFGTQNMMKSELVFNQNIDVDFLILEEPENNLFFTNMSILISKLSNNKNKQLFISTHSSFVANKLGLNKLHLVANNNVVSFSSLDKETYNYFVKLPGYNTLRLLLANKIILVEGPADELIIQKAYIDKYEKLPIDDGIDVLSVGGIAFERYCKIAQLINKEIIIVTDNDGNGQKVKQKYEEYSSIIKLCIEDDNELNTLEPSVLKANEDNFDMFRSIVYKGNNIANVKYSDLCDFMIKNKSEWALRIFQSEVKINYPDYIKKAIGDN